MFNRNINKLNETDLDILRAGISSRNAEIVRLSADESDEAKKRINTNLIVIGTYNRLIKIREVNNA